MKGCLTKRLQKTVFRKSINRLASINQFPFSRCPRRPYVFVLLRSTQYHIAVPSQRVPVWRNRTLHSHEQTVQRSSRLHWRLGRGTTLQRYHRHTHPTLTGLLLFCLSLTYRSISLPWNLHTVKHQWSHSYGLIDQISVKILDRAVSVCYAVYPLTSCIWVYAEQEGQSFIYSLKALN